MNGTGSLRSHPSPAASAPNVTIDRGVPIPARLRLGGASRSGHSATLRAMEVGDSFVYPAKNGEQPKRTARRASGLGGHLRPKKFSIRTFVENGKTVIRVWRVA